jgi:hypothetical protein
MSQVQTLTAVGLVEALWLVPRITSLISSWRKTALLCAVVPAKLLLHFSYRVDVLVQVGDFACVVRRKTQRNPRALIARHVWRCLQRWRAVYVHSPTGSRAALNLYAVHDCSRNSQRNYNSIV